MNTPAEAPTPTSSVPDPPRATREGRKVRTSKALVGAATQLFAEKGYEKATVEDIAQLAEVSPRTFFRYFATKEEVLFADEEEIRGLIRETMASRPEDEPVLEGVRHAMLAVAERFQRDVVFQRLRISLYTESAALWARMLQARWDWEIVLGRTIAERLDLGPEDFRPTLIAGVANSALAASMVRWGTSECSEDLPTLVADAFAWFQRGAAEVDALATRQSADSSEPEE